MPVTVHHATSIRLAVETVIHCCAGDLDFLAENRAAMGMDFYNYKVDVH